MTICRKTPVLLLLLIIAGAGTAAYNIATLDPVPVLKIRELKFPNKNLGLIRGKEGQVYQTVDTGATWKKLPFQASIISRSFTVSNVIFFLDGQIGFIGSPAGKINKTSNGGLVWTEISTGSAQSITSVTALDTNRLFAVTDSGTIYISSDGGSTWKIGAKTPYQIIHFKNDSVCMVPNGATLLLSQDTGHTWKTITFGSDIYSFYFVDDTTAYAMGTSGKWITTDLCRTWSEIVTVPKRYVDANNGWTLKDGSVNWFSNSQTDDIKLQFWVSDSDRYTSGPGPFGSSYVYRGYWESRMPIFPQRWIGPYPKEGMDAYFKVSFKDSLHGLAAFGVNIYQTNDGGALWKSVGKLTAPIVGFGHFNDSTAYVLSKFQLCRYNLTTLDTTVLATALAGDTFSLFSSIGSKCGILSKRYKEQPSQKLIWKTYRTDDEGASWNEINSSFSGYIDTWSTNDDGLKTINGKIFVFSAPSIYGKSTLFCSKDTGKTFVPINSPEGGSWSIINDSVYVVFNLYYNSRGDYRTRVYKTRNSGVTWSADSSHHSGTNLGNATATFLDSLRGFMLLSQLGGENGLLLYTSDAGKNFVQVSVNIGGVFSQPNNSIIAVSNPFGCFRITADTVVPSIITYDTPRCLKAAPISIQVNNHEKRARLIISGLDGQSGTLSIFNLEGKILFKRDIGTVYDCNITFPDDGNTNIFVYRFVVASTKKMFSGRFFRLN
jgi:photosystem II stability/assembly factor-like uncharacterized protein